MQLLAFNEKHETKIKMDFQLDNLHVNFCEDDYVNIYFYLSPLSNYNLNFNFDFINTPIKSFKQSYRTTPNSYTKLVSLEPYSHLRSHPTGIWCHTINANLYHNPVHPPPHRDQEHMHLTTMEAVSN